MVIVPTTRPWLCIRTIAASRIPSSTRNWRSPGWARCANSSGRNAANAVWSVAIARPVMPSLVRSKRSGENASHVARVQDRVGGVGDPRDEGAVVLGRQPDDAGAAERIDQVPGDVGHRGVLVHSGFGERLRDVGSGLGHSGRGRELSRAFRHARLEGFVRRVRAHRRRWRARRSRPRSTMRTRRQRCRTAGPKGSSRSGIRSAGRMGRDGASSPGSRPAPVPRAGRWPRGSAPGRPGPAAPPAARTGRRPW